MPGPWPLREAQLGVAAEQANAARLMSTRLRMAKTAVSMPRNAQNLLVGVPVSSSRATRYR
jgi:hypothetical protein